MGRGRGRGGKGGAPERHALPFSRRKKEAHDGNGKDGSTRFGASSMQGWRDEMEDAHITDPDFDAAKRLGLYAVFDGHGGAAVAEVTAKRFPAMLRKQPSFSSGDYKKALHDSCLQMDAFLNSQEGRQVIRCSCRAGAPFNPDLMGCTAIIALVHNCPEDPQVYVANVGDSRCVLISGEKAVPLSRDHNPNLQDERQRIYNAGGWVNHEGRINGNLNLSRAFGDFFYKRTKDHIISEVPEIKQRPLTLKDRFLLLGCDGIWEQFTNQGTANFVLDLVKMPRPLSAICGDFLDANLSPDPMRTQGLGCDNMSMILVELTVHPRVSSSDSSEIREKPTPKKRRISERSEGSSAKDAAGDETETTPAVKQGSPATLEGSSVAKGLQPASSSLLSGASAASSSSSSPSSPVKAASPATATSPKHTPKVPTSPPTPTLTLKAASPKNQAKTSTGAPNSKDDASTATKTPKTTKTSARSARAKRQSLLAEARNSPSSRRLLLKKWRFFLELRASSGPKSSKALSFSAPKGARTAASS